MSNKPTIILVPGAWHKASQYAPLTTRLQSAGYEVHGIDYPSTGPNPTNDNFDPDVAVIHSTIAALADEGKDVAVVVHSAAGILASEAAKALSKDDRNQAGGITHMVFLCAFAAAEGVSLYDATGGPEDWQIVSGPHVTPHDPKARFYNRCPPDVADDAVAQLGDNKFAMGTFRSKATYAAWKHIPCTYLICENDRAIPVKAQEAMVQQPGAGFEVVRCEADHSPFLCMPDFTAEVVRRAAGETVGG
ncbi:hypothetical protein LTR37_004868 [Vermiconidia calcicola]|uniref:Uncharacterized protein n=1 Tax=Vermiconidia calcicola TaxID=1690605 RepID=A0ACC3NKZ2_9PEZI|nr:hypothetical protein LTR37_004868 [Vermiconidia calcicola]